MKQPVKETRMILVGTVLIAIILTGKLVVFPLIEKGRSIEVSIQTQAVLLEEIKNAVLRKPELELKRKALEEEIRRFDEALIEGKTPTLASARLQSILEQMAKRSGTEINSVKAFQAEALVDYTGISVQFTLTSDIRSLLNLLYDIENGEKSFSIVKMDVHFQDHRHQPQLRTILKVEAGMKNDQGAVSLAEEGREVAGRKGLRDRS